MHVSDRYGIFSDHIQTDLLNINLDTLSTLDIVLAQTITNPEIIKCNSFIVQVNK